MMGIDMGLVSLLAGWGIVVGVVSLILKHMGREDISSIMTLVAFVVGLGLLVNRVIFPLFASMQRYAPTWFGP